MTLDFALNDEGQYYNTSLNKLWYPNETDISFKPVQIHFHMGHGKKANYTEDNGSENTIDGHHLNVEMHIVF